MKQPNIILIMTDQLRGDCLGASGHPDVKTPYLDTLAARGTVFDNAYSSCPSCIPARAAIHTGMSQEHHGRVGYEDMLDWDYPVTMAGGAGRRQISYAVHRQNACASSAQPHGLS